MLIFCPITVEFNDFQNDFSTDSQGKFHGIITLSVILFHLWNSLKKLLLKDKHYTIFVVNIRTFEPIDFFYELYFE